MVCEVGVVRRNHSEKQIHSWANRSNADNSAETLLFGVRLLRDYLREHQRLI